MGFKTFSKTNDRGYFTVVANPGEGKSAIASQYVNKNPDCIYYFNVRSDSQNRADQFLDNVCHQLIYRYQLGEDSFSKGANEDGDVLKELLQTVSEKLSGGEKLIIVVDALDEVDLNSQTEGANVLYLPRYLPKNVYFFLTRRDEEAVKSRLLIEAPAKTLYLKDYSEKSKQDIRAYIRLLVEDDPEYQEKLRNWIKKQGITRDKFIEEVAQKSENNFMYLRYVLPQIAAGYYQDLKLEDLPEGLTNYYRDHWRLMRMDRTKINIVYLLTVIRRPISRGLIAKFATVGELKVSEYTVQDVLREWSQFLIEDRIEGESRYKVYHASFADFLQSDEMVKAAGVEIRNIHGLIADTLWQELYGDEEDGEDE